MIHCNHCQKLTNNPKFCSSACAATVNNRLKNHNKPKKKYCCIACNTLLYIGWRSKRTKYCNKCRYTKNPNFKDWSTVTKKALYAKLKLHQAHARVRALARETYKKSNKPKLCANCGYDKFYEVCHIKPIQNFDETSVVTEINHIDNLIGLCPNCHWELDHDLLNIQDILLNLP